MYQIALYVGTIVKYSFTFIDAVAVDHTCKTPRRWQRYFLLVKGDHWSLIVPLKMHCDKWAWSSDIDRFQAVIMTVDKHELLLRILNGALFSLRRRRRRRTTTTTRTTTIYYINMNVL